MIKSSFFYILSQKRLIKDKVFKIREIQNHKSHIVLLTDDNGMTSLQAKTHFLMRFNSALNEEEYRVTKIQKFVGVSKHFLFKVVSIKTKKNKEFGEVRVTIKLNQNIVLVQ